MFGISYLVWEDICKMYFSIPLGSLKSYLQWFPFTKLSNADKEKIKSKEFFEKYINSGGFVLFPEVMRHSKNYIQKGDGSFRNSSLISPLLFLIIQAIGKEISYKYVSRRPMDIDVFYAGNYNQNLAKYGHEYDNFYKAINAGAEEFQYFIKTDITNFYSNININELINKINKGCNIDLQKITQIQLLLLKELLLMCGNGDYPLIENSMASSYLATVIYLDEIDIELHKFILNNVKEISRFRMVRYVDDLYILFSSPNDYDNLKKVYNSIKNAYSSMLKKSGLSLNVSKCDFKECVNINENLKRSLYDEYANGVEHDLGELFEGQMLEFLKDVYKNICDHGITYEKYLELIDKHFHSNDIELTATSVYNYFIYENRNEIKKEETIQQLSKIINKDISFLSIDPKRLSVMVMQSEKSVAIKALLKNLFNRNRAGLWNSYDTTTAIAYLIQSKFQHIDLLNILKEKCPDLYSYYFYACKTSFLSQLHENKFQRYLKGIGNDKKALFLYFMYTCEKNRSNYLVAYAYYKNFFDRVSADMVFSSEIIHKSKKPNYKGYYTEGNLRKLYKEIENSDSILKKAHTLRNQNPLCHSSASLVENNNSSQDLEQVQKELDYLLNMYSLKYYNLWKKEDYGDKFK